jgi:chemotaxis protein methyltransferase CheR
VTLRPLGVPTSTPRSVAPIFPIEPVARHLELTPAQFARVGSLVHRVAGIDLHSGKEGLVRSRLAPRIRELGIATLAEYFDFVERETSGEELAAMIDVLTTNKTSFFREAEHFRFLHDTVLPPLAKRPAPLRIWSAGCSSGEEAYTTAIVLRETLPDSVARVARILATDISARMIARGRAAEYPAETLAEVPPALLARHFVPAHDAEPGVRCIGDATRRIVRFARLNLMGDWPMHGPFDVILCRNVMIYFDRPTQETLVQRFTKLLAPGGYLLVGHSESLTALRHELRYVRPAVYVR